MMSTQDVNCRIGSLEIDTKNKPISGRVNCRIGSLESTATYRKTETKCKLPNRQFRNVPLLLCELFFLLNTLIQWSAVVLIALAVIPYLQK